MLCFMRFVVRFGILTVTKDQNDGIIIKLHTANQINQKSNENLCKDTILSAIYHAVRLNQYVSFDQALN